MMYLLLAALGLTAAFTAFDWGGSESDTPDDTGDGTEDPGDGDPDETYDGPGIIDIATGNEVVTGTGASDQLGAVGESSGGGIAAPTIEGAGGDDHLYVETGTAEGGDGDDTLSAEFNYAQAQPGGQVVLRGGAGDDMIAVDDLARGAEPHVLDGGAGDDTVSIGSVYGALDVTLGEGADALRASQDRSSGNGFGAALRVSDFDVDEDRVEFMTDNYPIGNAITGVDVSAEQVEGEDASRVSFGVNYTYEAGGETRTGTDTHEVIFEGFDPADADDIVVDILPPHVSASPSGAEVTPERDGTDLVFDITETDFVLPGASGGAVPLNLSDSADGDANPLGDIERVVLNISADVEGDIYTDIEERYSSVDLAGTETTTSVYLNILQGPEGLTGPGITQDKFFDDDDLHLTRGPQEGFSPEHRSYLAPFEVVGRIYLGAVKTDYDDPDGNSDTVNNVDVVVNRA